MRLRVYIAGPLGKPRTERRGQNIRKAVNAGLELIQVGFAPLIPHLTGYADPDDKLGREAWLEVCHAWVKAADALLRIPGDSPGADMEEAWAKEAGVPIFTEIASLVKWSTRLYGGKLQRR